MKTSISEDFFSSHFTDWIGYWQWLGLQFYCCYFLAFNVEIIMDSQDATTIAQHNVPITQPPLVMTPYRAVMQHQNQAVNRHKSPEHKSYSDFTTVCRPSFLYLIPWHFVTCGNLWHHHQKGTLLCSIIYSHASFFHSPSLTLGNHLFVLPLYDFAITNDT